MDWRTNRARLLVPGLILAVAGGCIEREGRPVNPCTQVTVAQQIQVNNVEKVDLLFMVDNSGSMSEEQASLTAEFPRMIRILASGDLDEDGTEDFKPVKDLNVGVITSDMGGGAFGVTGCESEFGDDGILRTEGRAGGDCNATYPSFLNFQVGGDQTPEEFAADVTCVATTGTAGCGFEQQLEAILKAVTPVTRQPWNASDFVPVGTQGAPAGLAVPFFNNSRGKADMENAGFFREDAVLAVIPVTDEEDCSTTDIALFNPDAPFGENLNLRCFQNPNVLHPVSRYVRGLLQARATPNLVIYAPIVGIPTELVPAPGASPDYEQLIGPADKRHELMVEVVDPTNGNQLRPSCDTDNGVAFPPIRLVQTAQQLQEAGAGVTVQSICQSDFSGALNEIIRQIASALGSACLPRPLNVEADGSVSCDVVVTMPEGMDCVEHYTPKLNEAGEPVVDEQGRAVCVIPQLVAGGSVPDGNGWFYDTFTDEGRDNCGGAPFQRIAFAGSQPPPGSVVGLECFQSVQGDGSDNVQIGSFCEPEADGCQGHQSMGGADLTCDPVKRTCGVQCSSDTDCRDAGLVGYVCDTRPLNELDSNLSSEPYNYCVNPTC